MADAIMETCRNVLSQAELSIFLKILQAGAEGKIPYDNAKMLAVRMLSRRNMTLAHDVEAFLYRQMTHVPPATVPRQGVIPPQHIVCQQGVIEIQERCMAEPASSLTQSPDMDYKSIFAAFCK